MSVATTDADQPQCDDALIKYQRQVLLGSIAAMLAHEFNNLMTPVLTRAEFAQSNPTEDMLKKAVDVTVREARRGVNICRRLMEVAQGDAPQIQDYPVSTALDNVGLVMARPIEKDGMQYTQQVAEGLTVKADAVLFDQLLLNLLLNARSATRPTRGSIRVKAEAADGMAAISICDSGTGIEAERMETIFQPFLAAEPRHEPESWVQVGLGLHACRWICRQHGARIEARNNEGTGCTFTVYWPLA